MKTEETITDRAVDPDILAYTVGDWIRARRSPQPISASRWRREISARSMRLARPVRRTACG